MVPFFEKKKSCFESAQFYFYWSVKQEQTFYPAKENQQASMIWVNEQRKRVKDKYDKVHSYTTSKPSSKRHVFDHRPYLIWLELEHKFDSNDCI